MKKLIKLLKKNDIELIYSNSKYPISITYPKDKERIELLTNENIKHITITEWNKY